MHHKLGPRVQWGYLPKPDFFLGVFESALCCQHYEILVILASSSYDLNAYIYVLKYQSLQNCREIYHD